VNDRQSSAASGPLETGFAIVALVLAMGRVDGVLLAAQDLVFGVKGLDRAFGTAVTEPSNRHGHQKRYPEEGEDY
jgi:hypothetical protein